MDATGGDGGDSGIEAVAFVNPDNSVIVVFDDGDLMVIMIMMIVGSQLWHLSILIIASLWYLIVMI